MKGFKFIVLVALAFFCFAGTADAQGKGKREQGKTVQEMDIVISEVGEATIGYQVEQRGRMSTQYLGVADVTRVQKADFKDVALKDLKPGDKAVVTVYKDPDDPYFPVLSIKVYGKGEMKKAPRKGKKGGGKKKR